MFAVLFCALALANAHAQKFSSAELNRRTIERRAVEAAIWGMPLINFDALREAFFRDSKANYGDIIYWSRPGSWKLQCLTPNTTVRYVFSFTNTRFTWEADGILGHGDVPAGFISVPMKTYNAFVGMPVVTKSEDEAFPYFRLYGSQPRFFAKTWKLPDIEKVK